VAAQIATHPTLKETDMPGFFGFLGGGPRKRIGGKKGRRSRDTGGSRANEARNALSAVDEAINRPKRRRDTSVRSETSRRPKGDGNVHRRDTRNRKNRRPGILRGFRGRK
jgi:hypothetical protein